MAVLSAVVAALALLAAPAGARQAPAVVAGPLPEGSTLVAFDRGGRLCLQVRAPAGGEPVDCLDALPDTARHVQLDSAGQPPGSIWFGPVPADVASVELRFGDGEVVAAPTSAGAAYRGRFGATSSRT
jgi:hypothetical protein